MSRTRDSWNEWMGRIIGRDNCFEGLSLRHDEGGGGERGARSWMTRQDSRHPNCFSADGWLPV